jgi:hypothetical protein
MLLRLLSEMKGRARSFSMKTGRRSMACRVHLHVDAASVALPPPRPGRCTFFVSGLWRRSAGAALLGAALGIVATALPACSPARSPGTTAEGGALTCDERMKAQALCMSALRQRCDSRLHDCEPSCDTSSVTTPSTASPLSDTPWVGDFDSTRCHDSCRQANEGCVRSIALTCPARCP